ncbi:DUF6082 family protein [Nocardia sp. CA2R105]|uniref:DUF6082 family protein n=1 Tax=Nocardia coffeae TaxID=2873381 RepID=UPI001CA78580|nr:DUF6082 family protein [Nocardia coffeae]MBY8863974.1 DUF6082 family protein [Nocardia coffeae]
MAVAVTTAGLAVVLLSPLVLWVLAKAPGVNWSQLQQVSQTYGATSTILSALALVGVAVSVFLQVRQSRAGATEATNRFRLELVKLAADEPTTYLPCLGMPKDGQTTDAARQQLFTLLWMQHQFLGFQAGAVDEFALRSDVLAWLFRGEVGREYWAEARHHWLQEGPGRTRTHVRFARITDEEYELAIASGPATVPRIPTQEGFPAPAPPSANSIKYWRPAATAVLGLVTGAGFTLTYCRKAK